MSAAVGKPATPASKPEVKSASPATARGGRGSGPPRGGGPMRGGRGNGGPPRGGGGDRGGRGAPYTRGSPGGRGRVRFFVFKIELFRKKIVDQCGALWTLKCNAVSSLINDMWRTLKLSSF